MIPFAIAGLQLRLGRQGQVNNLAHIQGRIAFTASVFPWVQMVVVSELATFGPLTTHAQPLPGPAERAYQEIAAKYGLWLLPGTLMELVDGRVYNTAPVIDPTGRVVARYRKMFPFLPYEQGVEAGTEFVVFDVPDVGRFGVSICYDTWFPETSRTLAAMGAEVILHPSMTTTIDRDVELAIARATAAQNQCYVVDINGAGAGGTGRSIIAGPDGGVVYQAGVGEEVIPLELDLARVRRSRGFGLMGLGQPLKSFRDATQHFDVYRHDRPEGFLERLGPLEKPIRGSRAGLDNAGSEKPRPHRKGGARAGAGPKPKGGIP